MIWFLSTVLCALLALLVLLDYTIKHYTTYSIAKSIPGPYMYPIIGAITFLGTSQHKTFQTALKYCSIFPNGFALWSFGVFVYQMYSADAFEKVVTNPKHIEKSFTYKFLHSLIGTGLLTGTGEKWFQRRKLLTPAFHFHILNKFKSTFNEQTALLIKAIRDKELNRSEGTHLQKLISRFTLNTVCESAMGFRVQKIDQLDDYRNKIDEVGSFVIERMTKPLFLSDFAYKWLGKGREELRIVKQVHEFTGNIIATKRAKFQLEGEQGDEEDADQSEYYGKKRRFAMLDTLLMAESNGQQIDAAGIQEEVDTFIFEGFDTTMTAISFILLLIACNNESQKLLFKEITSQGSDQDGSDMRYLDAVIKESLRLYPPVPFIGRTLGEDTIIDNVKFPAGTYIHILIYVLHRDPKFFPDPEKFDPLRFLGNDISDKHPFAYVPFSAGQRNCIGQKFAMMELRIVVSEIVRNFILEPITKVEDVEIISDLVLRSKDPIRIKFISRESH